MSRLVSMTMAGIEQLSTYSSVCFAFPRDLSSIVRPSNLAPPRIVIYAFRLINFSLIFVSAISLKLSASSADTSAADTRFTTILQWNFTLEIRRAKQGCEKTNFSTKIYFRTRVLDSSRHDRWNKISPSSRIPRVEGYPLLGREGKRHVFKIRLR